MCCSEELQFFRTYSDLCTRSLVHMARHTVGRRSTTNNILRIRNMLHHLRRIEASRGRGCLSGQRQPLSSARQARAGDKQENGSASSANISLHYLHACRSWSSCRPQEEALKPRS